MLKAAYAFQLMAVIMSNDYHPLIFPLNQPWKIQHKWAIIFDIKNHSKIGGKKVSLNLTVGVRCCWL